MSKSNHQKHGFHPKGRKFRDKNFVFMKSFVANSLKYARWNGDPVGSLFPGEVGKIEGVRFIEIGDQL
jgi:hypothetical protein